MTAYIFTSLLVENKRLLYSKLFHQKKVKSPSKRKKKWLGKFIKIQRKLVK